MRGENNQFMARQLSDLYIYPIKSLGGIRLTEARLDERGLAHDRRWMLIDDQGFLTQRQLPQMARLSVSLRPDHLEVVAPNSPSPLIVSLAPPPETTSRTVSVWGDESVAWPVSKDADAWFSEALGRNCSLVYMPDESERQAVGKVSGRPQPVSFADSYPVLLVGQASLDDLNRRLATPVPMDRFRPNMVFTGGKPYEEDRWHAFRVGEVACWAEKPCARCTMVTVNQETAERGREPLATLARYRQQGNKVMFGQNILYEAGKTVRVGDMIRIETNKPDFL